MKFKDDDQEHIDWSRILTAIPVWDEEAKDYYIPLSDSEMAAFNDLCEYLLKWRFRERPDLPIEMQKEQDRAWQEFANGQFSRPKQTGRFYHTGGFHP